MGGVGAALLVCACAWDAPPANVEGGGPGVNAEAPGGGLDALVQGVVRSQLRDTYAESRGDHAHEALDILAERGTPVLSATDARVLRLFDSEAGGRMVYAADPSGRFISISPSCAGTPTCPGPAGRRSTRTGCSSRTSREASARSRGSERDHSHPLPLGCPSWDPQPILLSRPTGRLNHLSVPRRMRLFPGEVTADDPP